MTLAPRGIGTFLDRKFKELVARKIGAARTTLFYEDQILLPGLGVDTELVRKEYAGPLFTTSGDSVQLEISGSFENNLNNKNITIEIQDETGAVFISTVTRNYSGADIAGNDIHFKLNASIYLTEDKLMAIHSSIISGSASLLGFARSDVTLVPYTATKCVISIQASGGAANDVIFYAVKGEFSPGILG